MIKNDVGTIITLNAGIDISAKTVLKIRYEKPSGDTGSWDAEVYNTDYARYTTTNGDIDESGWWKFHIYVEMPTWKGQGGNFDKCVG